MTNALRQVDLHTDVSWWGVVSLEDVEFGVQPWRLPHHDRALFPGGDLLNRARMPAGVRIALTTNSRTLAIETVSDEDCSPIDVVVGGRVIRLQPQTDRQEIHLEDENVVVWLPQYGQTCVQGLWVDSSATCAPATMTEPRWVVYGSSITQCRTAFGPTNTWPALCARRLDLDLLCLGFGGQCLLDPMVARLIRDTPADLITLCLGINVYGQATHNARSLLPAVLGFLLTVLDGHPEAPIQVISPLETSIPASERNVAGLSLPDVRRTIESAVQLVIDHGDDRISLLRGPTLLGPGDRYLLADRVHPSDQGYAVIADRMEQHLRPLAPHVAAAAESDTRIETS